ncbi:MAG: hypothetical protein FJ214_04360 [Ignavibacteria bacterium]|nr:hypothetical protein [Ignavibacteria bacterium]
MIKINKYLLLFLIPTILSGQNIRDSLQYSQKSFSNKLLNNSFDKQLNTYKFAGQLFHFYQTNNFFIGVKENFNSTIIKATEKNIKDEHLFSALVQYNINDVYKLGMMLNNSIYSDDRQIAINKASILNSTLFLKLSPFKYLQLTPFGGISNNNQVGEKNSGVLYGAEVNIDKFNFSDFEISSIFRYQNEDISPRKNTLRYINFDLSSGTSDDFKNTISAFFAHQRKDFYFAADKPTQDEFDINNNIQTRLETNYFLQEKIQFIPANSRFSLDAQSRISWRDIERSTRYISITNPSSSAFDSKINEFRLDFSSTASYKSEYFNLLFNFNFAERDEKHQPRKIEGLSSIIFNERELIEAQKNNTSQLANISISSQIFLSNKDYLLISLFHRKLKYDTPSEINYDDRDELLSIGRILYERSFNPFFKAFINLEASLNKIVYIFAQRSSNNNIKRILKLASGGIIKSNFITSINSAEVSANYTVFDYEELNPNFRSYSFRQIVIRDSTWINFSKGIKFFVSGYVKNSEQGNFKWSNFTSKPQRYLTEFFAEPKFIIESFGFTIGLGIRVFELTTYNIENGIDKKKASEYSSIGPISEINYLLTENLSFKTIGWYEFIVSENNVKREMANLNVKLSYRF